MTTIVGRVKMVDCFSRDVGTCFGFADIRGIARRLFPPILEIRVGARRLVLSIPLIVRRFVSPILE